MLDTLPEFLTEDQVAKILNIEKRGVKTERMNGRLRYRKVAGKVRIHRDDLEEFKRSTITCPAQPHIPISTNTANRRSGKSSSTTDHALATLALARKILRKPKQS